MTGHLWLSTHMIKLLPSKLKCYRCPYRPVIMLPVHCTGVRVSILNAFYSSKNDWKQLSILIIYITMIEILPNFGIIILYGIGPLRLKRSKFHVFADADTNFSFVVRFRWRCALVRHTPKLTHTHTRTARTRATTYAKRGERAMSVRPGNHFLRSVWIYYIAFLCKLRFGIRDFRTDDLFMEVGWGRGEREFGW